MPQWIQYRVRQNYDRDWWPNCTKWRQPEHTLRKSDSFLLHVDFFLYMFMTSSGAVLDGCHYISLIHIYIYYIYIQYTYIYIYWFYVLVPLVPLCQPSHPLEPSEEYPVPSVRSMALLPGGDRHRPTRPSPEGLAQWSHLSDHPSCRWFPSSSAKSCRRRCSKYSEWAPGKDHNYGYGSGW